ncbi:MAG: LLM class F420-dependent oxidoreductase [Alphaproteobacteria bacterium]|jgi:probable F420-dependent oxidoreductase|nr:LLM class F420-dependent oxidoreductase [Alphaproteobacteria bacterium]
MDVGVLIFATDYTIRTDELAIALEERGFESLFLPEHTHIPASRESAWPGGPDLPPDYWHTHDPFVALAYAGAVTKNLKLATGICLLAQRDPIVTAKNVASLDMMSNGRFLFGIGGGWNIEEMNDHGVEYKTRFAQMKEHVQAMKALWTEEDASFKGDFVNFEASWAHPKPVQNPHPPVILGGETDYTLARVVDYCDGWLPRARHGFDAAENMARLKTFADKAGRDASEISVSVFGAPGDQATLDSYEEAGVNRAILGLPSAPRDEVMALLDKYAPLAG